MASKFDTRAKKALKKWPAFSADLWPRSRPDGVWLRAQPKDGNATGPRLMAAGTDVFKTQPDGLWTFLSNEGFADCVAIEACSTAPNFADKRSRYMPTTTATIVRCPQAWLNGSVAFKNGSKCRWELAHGHQSAATSEVMLPVRFLRVLFFLKDDLYTKWRKVGVPSAHEFVASYSSIESYTAPKMQEFLRRMSVEQHFYKK